MVDYMLLTGWLAGLLLFFVFSMKLFFKNCFLNIPDDVVFHEVEDAMAFPNFNSFFLRVLNSNIDTARVDTLYIY